MISIAPSRARLTPGTARDGTTVTYVGFKTQEDRMGLASTIADRDWVMTVENKSRLAQTSSLKFQARHPVYPS